MKFPFAAAVLAALVASVSAHGSSGHGHGAARMESRAAPLAKVVTKCTKSKTVALTFDDGPWVYAYDISKALVAAGAKGTFFWNGNNYGCIYDADEQKRVKYIYKAGHQVASHTWAHLNLTTLPIGQIRDEMSRVDQALERILGVQPAFMRPPFGEYNDLVRQVAHERGQTVAIWDFDSLDSDGATAKESEKLYDALLAQNPKTILTLNHEPLKTTAFTVLPYVLKKLQAKGYKMVTLAECLGMPAYQSVKKPPPVSSSWKC